MAVKMRLHRTGRRKRPLYRIVVTEASFPRDGRFIEIVGHYDPKMTPAVVRVHADRVRYWLSQGVQPSDTVKSLLRRPGVMDGGEGSQVVVKGSS